jgi:transposase
VDLPVFEPVVIEAWQYTVACERCGEQTAGTYPAGLEPRRTFGPGVEALLSYLHERHHVSYERLVEICRDVFGLAISQGGVENALRRLVERARPTYTAIREQVRGSPVINSDETSARVAGRTHWQWVFQTAEASYHVIVPSRGGEVIDAFLAGAEPEVWGSDLWAPQILTPATEHQIWLSHQERDLTFAVDADTDEARLWAIELRHVFGRAIRLHHERTQVTPQTFARRRLLIENATDRLVFDRYVAPTTEAARLQQRYRTHRDSLDVFLHRDDVEPTNNSSERDLRPSVIHRKVIGGFRSPWGAVASAIRTTILATARKQDRKPPRRLPRRRRPLPPSVHPSPLVTRTWVALLWREICVPVLSGSRACRSSLAKWRAGRWSGSSSGFGRSFRAFRGFGTARTTCWGWSRSCLGRTGSGWPRWCPPRPRNSCSNSWSIARGRPTSWSDGGWP